MEDERRIRFRRLPWNTSSGVMILLSTNRAYYKRPRPDTTKLAQADDLSMTDSSGQGRNEPYGGRDETMQ